MNINHVESLFVALKKGCFPLCDGELEKKLRIAFTYGVDAGHQLSLQGTTLSNDATVKFFRDLTQQIDAELKKHKLGRAQIRLGEMPKELKPVSRN